MGNMNLHDDDYDDNVDEQYDTKRQRGNTNVQVAGSEFHHISGV